MDKKVVLMLLALLFLAQFAAVIVLNGCLSEGNVYCNETQSMEKCEGKTVRVVGSEPEFVSQHPLMNLPGQYQQYLDTSYGDQIVLLSEKEISCSGNVEIVGTLDIVEIECVPGQIGKCGYKGYFVTVEEWNCK